MFLQIRQARKPALRRDAMRELPEDGLGLESPELGRGGFERRAAVQLRVRSSQPLVRIVGVAPDQLRSRDQTGETRDPLAGVGAELATVPT